MMNKPFQWMRVFFASIFVFVLAGCGGGGGPGYTPTPTPGGGATIPGAPTSVFATAGNAQATVSFTPPASNGGSAITSYTVFSSGGQIATGTTTSIVVPGLTNGVSYSFTVSATNAVGTGATSAPSNIVVPTAPVVTTVPGAPTGVSAVAGNAMASVSFIAPVSNGGSAITGYTVTSSGGQIATGTTSPISVMGLTNGVAYSFTVKATNVVGTGAASAASNVATPVLAAAGPYFVNATTGLDTNAGTSVAPFKSITQGLNAAKAYGIATTVNVAAGTYSAPGALTGNAAETFPLKMVNNVNLVGDVINKGSTTVILGTYAAGNYTYAGTLTTVGATLVFPPGVTATVSGFSINKANDASVVVDGATSATFSSNTINNLAYWTDGMYIVGTSNVTLTGNTIAGSGWVKGGLYITGHSTVVARSNIISDTAFPAVNVLGTGVALTSPVVDLGTTVSAGLNTITGPAIDVGLQAVNVANWINASGNTWHANIQGASVTGAYTAGTVGVNPSIWAAGNNYSLATSTGLQF